MNSGDLHDIVFISHNHHGGVTQDPHLQETLDLDPDRVVVDCTPDQGHLDHTGQGHHHSEDIVEDHHKEGITQGQGADLLDRIDIDQGHQLDENRGLTQEETLLPEVRGLDSHYIPRANTVLREEQLKEEIVEVSAGQGLGTHLQIGSRRR